MNQSVNQGIMIEQNKHYLLATSKSTSGQTPPSFAVFSTDRHALCSISLLCSLHCSKAREISCGFRAWACDRQDKASSDAALTM